jgi:uncharacterized protein (TIGR00255 family)
VLLSMTGFGDARIQDDRLSASVEVRSVNNRYLKITTKCAEVYGSLEGDVERVVRETISRGTVNVTIRVDRLSSAEEFALNQVALTSYWSQLQAAAKKLGAPPPSEMGYLLSAPGVVADESQRSVDLQADGTVIRRLLKEALDKLQSFRKDEGRSMERELVENAKTIETRLAEVTVLAPQVVAEYRAKLLERVRQLLKESGVAVGESDLIREVSIFSDRSDINEEITRLRSHLEQFTTFIREPASAGRKLDFLSQEMNREVNTIGSKANNVAISHCVVEMKTAIEKIREILQNVE